jgi:hypothetical protein
MQIKYKYRNVCIINIMPLFFQVFFFLYNVYIAQSYIFLITPICIVFKNYMGL